MAVFSFFFPSLFSFRPKRLNALAIPKLSTFTFAPLTGERTCKSKRAKLPTHKILRALHFFSCISLRSVKCKPQAYGILFLIIFSLSIHINKLILITQNKIAYEKTTPYNGSIYFFSRISFSATSCKN